MPLTSVDISSSPESRSMKNTRCPKGADVDISGLRAAPVARLTVDVTGSEFVLTPKGRSTAQNDGLCRQRTSHPREGGTIPHRPLGVVSPSVRRGVRASGCHR